MLCGSSTYFKSIVYIHIFTVKHHYKNIGYKTILDIGLYIDNTAPKVVK